MRGIIGAFSRFQGYFRACFAPYTRGSRGFVYNTGACVDQERLFIGVHFVFNGAAYDMVECGKRNT